MVVARRVREGHGKWVVAARRNGCAVLRAWGGKGGARRALGPNLLLLSRHGATAGCRAQRVIVVAAAKGW